MKHQNLPEYGAIPRGVELINNGKEEAPVRKEERLLRNRKSAFLLASATLLLVVALITHPSSSSEHFGIAESNVQEVGAKPLSWSRDWGNWWYSCYQGIGPNPGNSTKNATDVVLPILGNLTEPILSNLTITTEDDEE